MKGPSAFHRSAHSAVVIGTGHQGLTNVVWILADTLLESRAAELAQDLEVVICSRRIRLQIVQLYIV